MKNDINTKALDIIKSKKLNKEFLLNCYKAEICPDCGSNLELDIKTFKDIEYDGKVFGIKIFNAKINNYTTETVKCPNDHKLISPWSFNKDVSYLGSIVWNDSIGEIGQAHAKDFNLGTY